MGFLKFLKKKGGKGHDLDLDVPPPPPDLAELPELPELPEERFISETEEVSELKQIQPKETIEEKPEPFLRSNEPKPGLFQKNIPEAKEGMVHYGGAKRKVVEEEPILAYKEAKGPIFIKVDRYKGILGNINAVKNNIKAADGCLVRLSELNTDRHKDLEKWHKVMVDIQKKLIFVDKALFRKT